MAKETTPLINKDYTDFSNAPTYNSAQILFADLEISTNGVSFMLGQERYRGHRYWNGAKYVMGYNYDGNAYPNGITETNAYKLFISDIKTTERKLKKVLRGAPESMLQHQWDALVSFYYSTGSIEFTETDGQQYDLLYHITSNNYDNVSTLILTDSRNSSRRTLESGLYKLGSYGKPKTRSWLRNDGIQWIRQNYSTKLLDKNGGIDKTAQKQAQYAYYKEVKKFIIGMSEIEQRTVMNLVSLETDTSVDFSTPVEQYIVQTTTESQYAGQTTTTTSTTTPLTTIETATQVSATSYPSDTTSSTSTSGGSSTSSSVTLGDLLPGGGTSGQFLNHLGSWGTPSGTALTVREVNSGGVDTIVGFVNAIQFDVNSNFDLQNLGSGTVKVTHTAVPNLTVSEINDANNNNVSVSNVTGIKFDANGGFALTDNGDNTITVGMESTFKTWKIYDTPSDTTPTDVIATGVDTISIKAGTGIQLAGVATAGSKSLTISSTAGSDVVDDTSPQLGGNLDTNGKNITFGDSATPGTDDTLTFGADADMSIYHDGANSYIDDTGTGSIFIRSGTTYFQNAAGTKTSIATNSGAEQTLYYNNNPVFATASGGVTVTGSLEVTGDLTISGTTTTLNTETVTVDDNIIVLNNNEAGTPSQNAGIEIERGTSPNVDIRWNETSDKWQFTNDGTNYTDIGAGSSITVIDESTTLTTGATKFTFTGAGITATEPTADEITINVPFDGTYGSLTGTPSLATVATSGAYSDLTGTPSLATVATSGAYGDLSGTPTIPTAASLEVDHLITLSGVASSSDNLGAFTGSTISGSATIKTALQELETAVEAAGGGGGSTSAIYTGILGVSNNATDFGTFTGSTISDNKDAKEIFQEIETSLENKTAAAFNVDHLITLSGVATASDHLGTFTGSTISDNQTIKQAIQALETAVESAEESSLINSVYTGILGVGAGDSNLGTFTGSTITDNVSVKAGMQELETSVETKLNSSGAQAALDVDHLITLSGVAAASDNLGTFTGSTISDNGTIKAGIQELETAVETKLNSSGAQAALDVDHLITLSGMAAASDNLGTFTGSIITDNTNIKTALQELENAAGSSTLSGLSDTTISNPQDNHILKYDTATVAWENVLLSSYTVPYIAADATKNLGVGLNALVDANLTGSNNTAVGYEAGKAITTGGSNVAIGADSLSTLTTGSANTSIGYLALTLATGSNSTAIGYSSLSALTTGTKNIAIGYGAGDTITTGSNNTIIGDYPGLSSLADTVVIAAGTTERIKVDSTGLYVNGASTAIQSYPIVTPASDNIGVGANSLTSITTGDYNTAIGISSLESLTTGAFNVAVGMKALNKVTINNHNVALGYSTLENTASGSSNVAVGSFALQLNIGGQNNVAVGYDSGKAITYGNDNTLIGYKAGESTNTGTRNVAVGRESLATNTTGTDLVAIGHKALNASTGDYSVAVGTSALLLATGDSNTAVGFGALEAVTTGTKNTGIGDGAGMLLTTGSNNTIIGSWTGAGQTTISDTVVISAGTQERIKVDGTGLYVNGTAFPAATKANLDVDHLITLTGMPDTSDHLGTFTGAIITDNSTIKTALQELETNIESSAGAQGNVVSATADGNLIQGAPAIVNSDGTVSPVFTQSGGTLTGVIGQMGGQGQEGFAQAVVWDTHNNRVVFMWPERTQSSHGYYQVGSVAGNGTITLGTAAHMFPSSTYFQEMSATYDSYSKKIIAVGNMNGTFGYSIGTVDAANNTVSWSSIGEVASPAVHDGYNLDNTSIESNGSGKILVGFGRTGSQTGKHAGMHVGTIDSSGTSITWGSAKHFSNNSSGNASNNDIAYPYAIFAGSKVVYIADWFSASGVDTHSVVGTVDYSTNTITADTDNTDTGVEQAPAECEGERKCIIYDTQNEKIVWFRKTATNSGNIEAYVGTITGTSISWGTAVVAVNSGIVDTPFIKAVYDTNTKKCMLFYTEQSGNPASSPANLSVTIGTVSGTTITFETPIQLTSNANAIWTANWIDAAFNANTGQTAISIEDDIAQSVNTEMHGIVFTSTSKLTSTNYIGIANANYTGGSSATVITDGAVATTNQTGLTVGATYYVTGTGEFSTTPGTPKVVAGEAVSSTAIQVALRDIYDLHEVASSGSYNDLLNLPAPSSSFTATAAGSLVAGDVVALSSNGSVSPIGKQTIGAPPSAILTYQFQLNNYGQGYNESHETVYDTTNNRVVWAFQSGAASSGTGRVRVGSVDSSQNVSWGGSSYVFDSTAANANGSGPRIVGSTFYKDVAIVIYRSLDVATGSYKMKLIAGSTGVGSITWGSAVDGPGTSDEILGAGIASSADKFLLAHIANDNNISLKPGDVSGTTITLGNTINWMPGGVSNTYKSRPTLDMVFVDNDTCVMVAFGGDDIVTIPAGSGNPEDILCTVITISSSLIPSRGLTTSISGTKQKSIKPQLVYDSNNDKVILTYIGSDSKSIKARIGTIDKVNKTSSWGSEINVFTDSTNNLDSYISTVYHSNLGEIAIFFGQKTGTALAPYSDLKVIFGSISGSSMTFDDPVMIIDSDANQANSLPHIETMDVITSAYNPSTNDIVCTFKDTKNSSNTGGNLQTISIQKQGTSLSSTNFVGFSDGTYNTGSTATIITDGAYISQGTNITNLTAGSIYYARTDGTISTTNDTPKVVAGRAVSSSILQVTDSNKIIEYADVTGTPSLPTQADLEVDHLITLTGMPGSSDSLGSFTGSTITDNTTIKNALQELEVKTEQAGISSLDGLSDTDLSNVQTGEVLKYNGTKWANGTDIQGGSGGSNLSAVNVDIIPSLDGVYDIGSTSKRFYEGHFSDNIKIGDATIKNSNSILTSTSGASFGSLLIDQILISDNLITPDTTSFGRGGSEYGGLKGCVIINGNLDVDGDWLQVPKLASTIGPTTQTTGTGLNDATFAGPFIGTGGPTTYSVKITSIGTVASGTTDKFSYSKDNFVTTLGDFQNAGSTWTSQTVQWGAGASNDDWRSVASNQDLVIAVGRQGYMTKSTDGGETWSTPTSISSSTSVDLNDIIYIESVAKWIAVGNNGSGTGDIRISSDGTTWTQSSSLPTQSGTHPQNYQSVAAGNGKVVISAGGMGSGGGQLIYIADETNLNSWTGVTISSSLGTHKRGVATDGDGTWVVVCGAGSIIYSTNNTTSWSVAAPAGGGAAPFSDDWTLCEFVNGSFIIGGFGGKLMYATSAQVASNSWNDLSGTGITSRPYLADFCNGVYIIADSVWGNPSNLVRSTTLTSGTNNWSTVTGLGVTQSYNWGFGGITYVSSLKKIIVTATNGKIFSSTDGTGVPISITGSKQALDNGITIKFDATTGHTVGDIWQMTTQTSNDVTEAIPTQDLLGIAGIMRFNESTSKFEGHNGTEWGTLGGLSTDENGNAQVIGNLVVTGDVISLSDESKKENIIKIDSALDKIEKLEGVFYNFIEEPNTRRTGLIAQNVEKVLPEVIYDNEDGKNIAYGNMAGLLIEAIKELKTEINEIKNGISNK